MIDTRRLLPQFGAAIAERTSARGAVPRRGNVREAASFTEHCRIYTLIRPGTGRNRKIFRAEVEYFCEDCGKKLNALRPIVYNVTNRKTREAERSEASRGPD